MIPLITLLVLTGIDGHTVLLNSDQITSMHSEAPIRSKEDRIYHEKAKCLISTTDGKNLMVMETCDQIKILMEQPR